MVLKRLHEPPGRVDLAVFALDDAVARAPDGFILTGDAAGGEHLLETSVPGIFAAGDVRSGSTKRCAAAVGEGSMAVQFVHEHLAAARARTG